MYKVAWAQSAVRDIEDLMTYIAADSPGNAPAVLNRIKDRVAKLETMPSRGRFVPETARLGLRLWRELIIKPYRIIFRIEKDLVYVLAVLDCRRDIEDLLFERLVRD